MLISLLLYHPVWPTSHVNKKNHHFVTSFLTVLTLIDSSPDHTTFKVDSCVVVLLQLENESVLPLSELKEINKIACHNLHNLHDAFILI